MLLVFDLLFPVPFNVGLELGQGTEKKHYKTTLEERKTGIRAMSLIVGVIEKNIHIEENLIV